MKNLLLAAIPVLLVAGAAAGIFFFTDLEWRDIPAAFEKLDTLPLLVLMALLPIAGFPISVVYLAAGARFGPLLGGGVVAILTAIHLLGTHWVARSFLRGPIERWLVRRGHKLPEVPPGEQAGVAAVGVLVPGPPYFARNYLLALASLPAAYYYGICVPLYTARSYVVIFLGDLSQAPSLRGMVLLGGIYALKLGACAWVLWRLRLHYRRRRGLDSGGKPAAQPKPPRRRRRAGTRGSTIPSRR